ncbi:MAG: ATP-binding cassette domain-containing protein [Bacilli bacterium]|nr:ATP-binding cassette domain-containing protein [Bacilli bacterium]
MTKIIEINNFSDDNLFENLNINVEKNKITTISGANSCGKTTLIRILNREIITDSNILLNNININDYTISEYISLVQTVIPFEIVFQENTLEKEIKNLSLVKGLRIKSILTKNIKELTIKEKLLAQVAIALDLKPQLLLLDNIFIYFNEKEKEDIFKFLRNYQKKYNLTVILTTTDLKDSLYTDYLYIIGNKKVILKGEPLKVLEKDNILNKVGLNIPFMADLSVKLKDYDLLDSIILDQNKMVDILWK